MLLKVSLFMIIGINIYSNGSMDDHPNLCKQIDLVAETLQNQSLQLNNSFQDFFQDLNVGRCMDGDMEAYGSYWTTKAFLGVNEDTSNTYGKGRHLFNQHCADFCQSNRAPGFVAFQTNSGSCVCLYSLGSRPEIPSGAIVGNYGCAQGQVAALDHDATHIMYYPVKSYEPGATGCEPGQQCVTSAAKERCSANSVE